nr:uncharacterized protein LOC129435083 [Misgurnus anguillicaudatus]
MMLPWALAGLNKNSAVEIRGKRGRKVAVLLSPDMVDALTLLVRRRSECEVQDTNSFLFARPNCQSHYRGQDCIRVFASECGAQHPEFLRSTHLRKHVATLSQILNLKNNELDQVADFLGHDIRVHRDYYRLPEATTQLAKISKLLLAMEKGCLPDLQGKSLDDIELEDEISVNDSEDSGPDESDVEDDVPAAASSRDVPAAASSCDVSAAASSRVVSAAGSSRDVSAAGSSHVVSAAGSSRVVSAAGSSRVASAAGSSRVASAAASSRVVSAAASSRVVSAAASSHAGMLKCPSYDCFCTSYIGV